MPLTIEMRDGIFSCYIRSDKLAIRAIALVESATTRGFNPSRISSVERLKYSVERLLKHRNTHWRVKAMEYPHAQGVFMRGFPAKLEGEEGEEQFWFKGESDFDRNIRVEINGEGFKIFPA